MPNELNNDLKAETSRRNGAKSRGPKTTEGKARSSRNALKHGLSSATVVLSNESQELYDQLLTAYRTEWDPQGQTENDLLVHLVNAEWRLRRIAAIETASMDTEMFQERKGFEASWSVTTPAMRQADALQSLSHEDPHFVENLDRFEARYHRAHQRAYTALVQCRRLRGLAAPPSRPAIAQPAAVPIQPAEPGEPAAPVLQNEPEPTPMGLLQQILLTLTLILKSLIAAKQQPRTHAQPRNLDGPVVPHTLNTTDPEKFSRQFEFAPSQEAA